MSATAGYISKLAVTTTATNPGSSDVCGIAVSTGLNKSFAELETNYLGGGGHTSYFAGLRSIEVPFSGDYDSADTALTRLEAAHDDGSTIYVHVLFNGTTGKRVPCKVPGFSIESSVDGKVTVSVTLKSVGAAAASTLS